MRTNRLMLAQGATYYCEADVYNLRILSQAYLELAQRTKHAISLGWAYFMLGWCAYQENDLSRAEQYFSEVIGIRYLAHMRTAVDGFTGLALVKRAQGDLAEAKNVLQILHEFIIEQGAVALLPLADSLAVRLEPDDRQESALPGQERQMEAQLASDPWELPILTACEMDILSGDARRLAAVEETLAGCQAYAQSRNAKRQLLRIGVLQALLHEARGDHQRALETLRETLLLGEPGGALRCFVGECPGLLPLLHELRDQGAETSYIERILAVYRQGTEAGTNEAASAGARQSALSPMAVALLSEITNREMEVLLLLAERLTNKEIAERLHISPRTVKKHSINLYQKLEVENRRQAVARALEVGIL